MRTTQKTQLNLFNPFFTEELDYKNEYVSYIIVGGNSSVTPKSNNNITSQSKKSNNNTLQILERIEALRNQSLQDFRDKYEEMIFAEQDRRIRDKMYPQPHNNALSLV